MDLSAPIRIFYTETFGDLGTVRLSFTATFGEYLALLLLEKAPAPDSVLNQLGMTLSPQVAERWECHLTFLTLEFEAGPLSAPEALPWKLEDRNLVVLGKNLGDFQHNLLRHLHYQNWPL